jgi:hypothetical protein
MEGLGGEMKGTASMVPFQRECVWLFGLAGNGFSRVQEPARMSGLSIETKTGQAESTCPESFFLRSSQNSIDTGETVLQGVDRS